MIEKTVYDYLSAAMDTEEYTIPCFMEVPLTPPGEYITIEKTGSAEENKIRRASLAIQSHAQSLLRAAEINELVIAAMDAIVSVPAIFSCKINGDYNFTDTRTKEYRYQAIFNIYY